ncbi:hypothetical protein [Desulfovibrio sp. TomC]|uniref:hypothetical protein n=1 Tax=Desulfovibrio sp. TomC TaxID=1562888 RepID=UPI0009E2E31E|nr:hypothetical protein [Desulfovibrio sp. TomC]
MPATVNEVNDLKMYLTGVMKRADHHANNVNEVVLTLIGALLWKKDQSPITVMTRENQTTNVLWVYIQGKKYAFSYNHDTKSIEMRLNSTQGDVLKSFNNQDSATGIRAFFETL